MMLTYALQYASLGWPVFPTHWMTPDGCSCGSECGSPGKHPLTRHGLKDASSDADVIWRWWQAAPNANIAVATGSVYVVDLDGLDGIASWDALVLKYGEAPTRTARTGGDGRHLYYRMPEGGRLPNTAGKLGRKIDTRGHGGYVLAPPSNHKSGGTYAWLDAGVVADLPRWIEQVLAPKLPRQKQAAPDLRSGTPYGMQVVNRALDRIRQAPEGQRNETLNYEAFIIGQYVAGGEIGIGSNLDEALVAASGDPELEKSRDTVRRALQEGFQFPRKKADDDDA